MDVSTLGCTVVRSEKNEMVSVDVGKVSSSVLMDDGGLVLAEESVLALAVDDVALVGLLEVLADAVNSENKSTQNIASLTEL